MASEVDPQRRIIEIPTKNNNEVIELEIDDLPGSDELILILREEEVPLPDMLQIANAYYSQEHFDSFKEILKAAIEYAGEMGRKDDETEKCKFLALNRLAAFHVQSVQTDQRNKKDHIEKATQLYSKATQQVTRLKGNVYETYHLLGRAFLCLLDTEVDRLDQANEQFQLVLKDYPIPSYIGKACVAYSRKDYKTSLNNFRLALKLNSECLPTVRLGIALCALKLNRVDLAKASFERILALDPSCVDAMVGLAMIYKMEHGEDAVKKSVQLLSMAYKYDENNPQALNQWAHHFFVNLKDYEKTRSAAFQAIQVTSDRNIQAESYYHMARAYHVEGDYDKAFQFYYQSMNFASASFVLPNFGLGKLYIYKDQKEQAIEQFEKVLKVYPKSYETMKILGLLYAHSPKPEHLKLGQTLLESVVEIRRGDLEAWIELAGVMEVSDVDRALQCYDMAIKLYAKGGLGDKMPSEILNNMATLHHRQKRYEKAFDLYREALESIDKELIHEDETQECIDYFSSIRITIEYNMGLLYEMKHEIAKSEAVYQSILTKKRSYVDCYMRLGCIARDRGATFDAKDFFKEVLEFEPKNSDAWTLLGNIHMSLKEWNPAQKIFDRILETHSDDTYALVALGNIWYATMLQTGRNKPDRRAKAEDRSIQLFKYALKIDPNNIWATNGLACVLATVGSRNEAGSLFAQVREATGSFYDVWMNKAHILMEEKSYVAAEQMYETGLSRFSKQNHVPTLMCLAKAFFKSKKYSECLRTLLHARHINPAEQLINYNVCLTLERFSAEILSDERSTLREVLSAVRHLHVAKFQLQCLAAANQDHVRYSVDFARQEEQTCADLLSQAKTFAYRAKRHDEMEQENLMVQQRAQESAAKQDADRRAVEEQRRQQERANIEDQRRVQLDKSRQLTEALQLAKQAVVEKQSRKSTGAKHSRNGGQDDDFVQDMSSDDDQANYEPPALGEDGEPLPKKRREHGKKRSASTKSSRKKGEKGDRRRRGGDDDEEVVLERFSSSSDEEPDRDAPLIASNTLDYGQTVKRRVSAMSSGSDNENDGGNMERVSPSKAKRVKVDDDSPDAARESSAASDVEASDDGNDAPSNMATQPKKQLIVSDDDSD